MGKENKKWYQTGEFEDGYQFGDVFRTIKNTLSANSKKKNTNKRKTTEENNEDFNNVKASLSKIERGRLSANAAARLFGFADEVERKDYIKQNPHLYAVMGGHKYELDESSKNYVLLKTTHRTVPCVSRPLCFPRCK